MRLRIDELAARSGTTSRNIRAYQNRGILPAPELDGRTGFYGEEHLQRLMIIADLQDRGFSLAAIKDTLEAWASGGQLSHLLGLRAVLAGSFDDEPKLVLDWDQLAHQFPRVVDRESLISEAVEKEVLNALGDGTYEVPSPMLLEAGRLLMEHDIPMTAVLDVLGEVRGLVNDIAGAFVRLVVDHLARPVLEGTSTQEPEDVQQLLGQLVPLAAEVLRPLLAQELPKRISEGIEELGPLIHGSEQLGT